MRGDKLVIREGHRRAARQIAELLEPEIRTHRGKFVVSIAGESGAGKSEIAHVVSEELSKRGFPCIILQQDDYFVHPPKTNERLRREDIGHVGLSEVRLDLLDANLKAIKEGSPEIEKPLVIFDEDRIMRERVAVKDARVVLVEGTYTTLLENVDRRVFIELTCHDTKESRTLRARERQDAFLEEVLLIEHGIISRHRDRADLIVTSDYDAKPRDERA